MVRLEVALLRDQAAGARQAPESSLQVPGSWPIPIATVRRDPDLRSAKTTPNGPWRTLSAVGADLMHTAIYDSERPCKTPTR